MAHTDIRICRVYSPPVHKEGVWLLVDRLWPRGIKKESIDFDLWLKDITPSPELRKWFNHEPEKWADFACSYIKELQHKPELIKQVQEMAKNSPVTLFYAAKDTQHTHALVLQAMLRSWPDLPDIALFSAS
ncbi:DUF488 domain-containing protein [Legionella fallonii]|uniref:Uroporphyrin-III C-methyltransferase n=1 Tax=Legionella fallonii LLAP-10 TaxID=1212491 RepID=A0A098G8E6_9GAMM|nr:DUF488 family protein [Legionella fallonii]CEG57745.1 conserved protein of unknown function [Legionella fallonii LLAP-10]